MVKVQHTGALARGWSLLPPLSGLDVSGKCPPHRQPTPSITVFTTWQQQRAEHNWMQWSWDLSRALVPHLSLVCSCSQRAFLRSWNWVLEPFGLDSLAALCSCSQRPLSAFSQMLTAERKSNDYFCNAFSTGLLPHKIKVHTVSLSCACCELWCIQCPDGWCPVFTSETLQLVCSVLLGAKLLCLVVVGAVPKSNPSLSFLGYFCFWLCRDGTSNLC